MPVTFFVSGLTVADESAARADAFCEAVMLGEYIDAHDGQPPTGWPSPLARKTLIEWSVKFLIASRVKAWEKRIGQEAVTTDPWEGIENT